MKLAILKVYHRVRDWLGRHPHVRRRLKKILVVGAIAWALGLGALYFAARWQPSFYLPAVNVADVDYQVVENQISDLLAAIETEGEWKFTFSEDHINKWIDTDLHKSLPRVVPNYIRDPRVAIRDEFAQVAGEYRNGNVSLVLSICVEPVLSDKPNEIGIRLSNSKIGAVPGLMAEATKQVHWATRRGRMLIRWRDRDGSTPEAIITLPRHLFAAKGKKVTIEDVTMTEGRIHVVGSTMIVPVPQPKKRLAKGNATKTQVQRQFPPALKKIYIDQALILSEMIGVIY